MKYETIMKNIETSKTVTVSHIAEVIENLLSAYDDEQLESWSHLFQLLQIVQTAERYNGDSNTFHNLAVTLARADQYDQACDILKIGLSCHEKSLDLLADFLAYAIKCNRLPEASTYFNILMEIDKKDWNWRAFDFSIDYLMELLLRKEEEENIEKINNYIDIILKNFKEYRRNDERAYYAEYSVAFSRGQEESAITELERVLAENPSIKAPKCAIKIAEYYFDCGQYDVATSYIQKCKSYVSVPQPSIEPGYVYMLSALCGISKLYSIGLDSLDEENKKKQIDQIYRDCEATSAAYRRNRFSNYKNLETQRDILEKLSGISYLGE